MNDRQEQSARAEQPAGPEQSARTEQPAGPEQHAGAEQPAGPEQSGRAPRRPPSKRDSGVWRDPRRLPLSELDQAMAVYSADGEVDDATGGDAGSEDTYGHEAMPKDKWKGLAAEPGADPDATSEEGRRLRPSPDGPSSDGRTGPA